MNKRGRETYIRWRTGTSYREVRVEVVRLGCVGTGTGKTGVTDTIDLEVVTSFPSSQVKYNLLSPNIVKYIHYTK